MRPTYAWLVPNVVFPLYERASGRRLWSEVARLRALQWRPAEELEARAVGRLRRLLEHAGAHVPYYRELLGSAGITAGSIRTLADLAKIPPTTKADLRRSPASVVADNLPQRRRWRCMTSGSTGFPFEFYVDAAGLDELLGSYLFFLEWAGAAVWQCRVDLGVRLGRSWHPGSGTRWSRLGREVLLGEKIRPLLAVHLSARDFRAFVARIAPRRGYFVRAYTASATRLATRLLEDGVPLRPAPRVVITCAETLTRSSAGIIGRAFGCRVVNQYSCWEALHLAQSCPDHPELLHVNPERAVLRVVRADGSPAAPGEQGRVLLTALSNDVQPFINYDIGDWGAVGVPCPCGRGFPTLSRLEGRTSEVIRSPSGEIVSSIVLNQLPSLGPRAVPAIWEYQAVQVAPDAVSLRVVPAARFTPRVAAEIRQELAACLGPQMSVVVEVVEQLPPDASGKRPIVVPWSPAGAADV
jgi:phenylacetate-CoA ligase